MIARHGHLRLLLLPAVLLGLSGGAPAAAQTAQGPEVLHPPAGERVLFDLQARGVQIYACQAATGSGGFAWTLKAPEATLFDDRGEPWGRHSAGPSWEAPDGSRIVGEVRARMDAPVADAIPWLLLSVRSHEGTGRFTPVASIQRLDTIGGVAPAGGCDAAHHGAEVQVPYTARYVFYGR